MKRLCGEGKDKVLLLYGKTEERREWVLPFVAKTSGITASWHFVGGNNKAVVSSLSLSSNCGRVC